MRILLVSSDDSLLTTRALILTGIGFEVCTALDLVSAERAVDYYKPEIVVLGHTLEAGTQDSYRELLQRRSWKMQFISLSEGVRPTELISACCEEETHAVERAVYVM